MIRLTCLFSILISSGTCKPDKQINSSLEVVMMRIPFPRWDGISKVVEKTDTVWFVKSGNIRLFIMPGLREIIDGDHLNPVIRQYKYFLYKEGADTGLLYDSANAISGAKKIVDSFFEKKFYGKVEPINKYNAKVNTFVDEEGNTVDVYALNNKPDRSYPDTSLLYYNARKNELHYSFSESLDSIRGMKLYKFRFVFKADVPDRFEDARPAKEYLWEIKEDTLLNKSVLSAFIEKHKAGL